MLTNCEFSGINIAKRILMCKFYICLPGVINLNVRKMIILVYFSDENWLIP